MKVRSSKIILASTDMDNFKEQILNLKCSHRGGYKAPHKAIYLLSIIDLIEFGNINSYRFNISPELISAFEKNWRCYVGNNQHFKCNIWNPMYYMELDIIFKVAYTGYENIQPHSIERCSEVYQYFEFSPNLWKMLQNSFDREKLRKLLIDTYIINNRPKNKNIIAKLIPLLINSCHLLAM